MMRLMKKFSYAVLLTFVAVAFIIYFQSLHYAFILDDIQQVVNNSVVHNFRWAQIFSGSTMADEQGQLSGVYYKPIMMLVYSVLWKSGGGAPFTFHLAQIVLHALNAFLVYLLFSQIYRDRQRWVAMFSAMIFLVHPINTEAVVFIADLQEPLFTFFGLLALLVFIKSQKSIATAGAAVLLLLSLLSKESGVLYVGAVILYATFINKKEFKRAVLTVTIPATLYLILRLAFTPLHSLYANNMAINRASFLERLMTVPKVLAHYIYLFFYPNQLSLTQDWVINQLGFYDFWVPLALVLFILSISLWLCKKLKSQSFNFFLFWFLAGWGLHSQIIPLDGTVSDRWFYFTMIGLLGMLFEVISKIDKKFFSATVAALLVCFSWTAYKRVLDWSSELSLYGHDLKVSPESFYLNNNYGLALMSAGRSLEAIPYFQKCIELSPEKSNAWYTGYQNIGAIYLLSGDYAISATYLHTALESHSLKSYRAYAWLLKKQEKQSELKIFLEQQALVEYPQDPVLLSLRQ